MLINDKQAVVKLPVSHGHAKLVVAFGRRLAAVGGGHALRVISIGLIGALGIVIYTPVLAGTGKCNAIGNKRHNHAGSQL